MRCARRAWWSRFVRSGLAALGLVLMPALGAAPLAAQSARDSTVARPPGPWFAGLSLGYGSLHLTSDQRSGDARSVFVMGFRGGRAINERLRVGIDIGGWLLEPGDVWDPSQGESVSVFGAFAQLFPIAGVPFYAELGGGSASYTDNSPSDFDRRGTGWTLGAGYEWRSGGRFVLVPGVGVGVSGGRLGDISNGVLTETGLRYRAWDMRLTGLLRFGRRD